MQLTTVLLQANSEAGAAVAGAFFLVMLLVSLLIAVATIAGMWKTFSKAGEPGWAAIIPIYNVYVMTQIGDNEWWWLLLLLVPIVNLYAQYKIFKGVSEAFGQGLGITLGLFFLPFVFFPILGFGDFEYVGAPA
jgi:hypothetical protein